MKWFATKKSDSTQLLAQAFDRYYLQIYRYFRFRGVNVEEAKDLASRTFEMAIQHWNQFDPQKGQIQTWLFAIAHNLAINHWKIEKTMATDPLNDDLPDYGKDDFENRIITQEHRGQLLAALNSLDLRSRQIIALKFGGPLTNRQIGQLMDISEQNVAVILFRSLMKIRKKLANGEVNDDNR